MGMWLRQSTASQEILLGRFVDSTDGDTEETALSIANTDIKLWKEGGTTLANKNSGGATHIANGMYYAVLDATDTDTLGKLEVNVHVSGALAVRREYMVLPAMIYDSLVLGTDRFDANVTHVADTAQTARDIGASVLLSSGTGTGQLDFTGGVVKANVTQYGGSAGTFASGVPAVNASQFGGAPVTATTSVTFPAACTVATTTGAVGSVTGNVGGNVVGSVGSISGVSFPSNFSAIAITAGGIVQADVQTIKTQAVTCAAGVTVGAFVGQGTAAIGVNASGHVSRVVLCDTITTYTGDTPQTGDSFARIGAMGSGLTSLAPSATALSTATWTTARAGYLDNVNNANLASVPAFPSNFASLGINASGHVSRVTLADTVTTLTNLPTAPTDWISAAAVSAAAVTKIQNGLSTVTTSQVNAEVVDALATDTYAEPSTAPGATVALSAKIGYLYQVLRNKVTVTSSAMTFYTDAGASLWVKALADDGVTYQESEGA